MEDTYVSKSRKYNRNLNSHLLLSQHSMPGHPRPASETPLDRATIVPLAKRRFASGPEVACLQMFTGLCVFVHA